MASKILKISILKIILLFTVIVFFINLLLLNYNKHYSLKHLISLLKVYTVYDHKGPIKLIRLGKDNDGGYIVPELAIKNANSLIGYGIDNDISFEEQFSERYNKPSYGFDCGITHIKIKNKLCHFIPECIANDNFLYKIQKIKSLKKISSFSQQLNNLKLQEKQIFIKMDIEGAEYNALPEILNYAKNITGIVFEIHITNDQEIKKAINLLHLINKQFLLIHVHANNFSPILISQGFTKKLTNVVELTYINKSLVHKFKATEPKDYYLPIDMPNDPTKKEIKWINTK